MTLLEVHVDADFFEGLHRFAEVASESEIPWLIVGATARILLLEKIYRWPVGLATQDTDFAVQVGSWTQYAALCERLLQQPGFEANNRPAKRFQVRQNLQFDLLPYGGVEEKNRQVFWPPDRDYLMTVRGFAGAARNAVIIRVNDALDVPVASPAGLCALKLFAWEERHAQEVGRDARDIAYLFKHIECWLPNERLFEVGLSELEAADYDAQLAALNLFGQKVCTLLAQDEHEFLCTFLTENVTQGVDGRLIRDLTSYLKPSDPQRTTDMLANFLHGLNRET